MFLDRAGESRVDHAGFDHGDPVDGADLQDAVHLGEGQHDAALGGVGAAGQAGAGPLRDDGDAQLGGRAHDVLDLFDGAREDNDGGGARRAEARHVVGVGGRDVGVGQDGLGRQAGQEPVGEVTGVLVAGCFDTAHDHSVSLAAIGVNPARAAPGPRGCARRIDAQ